VLQKVKLLVGSFNDEFIPLRGLVRSSHSERRVCEDAVEAWPWARVVEAIGKLDLAAKLMEEHVHHGEAAGEGCVVGTGVGAAAHAKLDFTLMPIGAAAHPLGGGEQKPTGSAGGVVQLEIRGSGNVRLEALDDEADEGAGREILAGPFLTFAGGSFKEP